jgi:hypothetical protein
MVAVLMTEPTLFGPEPTEPLPVPGQRIAFTGGGQHWHGTVTRTSGGTASTSRICADVDYDSGVTYHSVDYRGGPHFRLTSQGEQCPDCGKPDQGPPMYGRYF